MLVQTEQDLDLSLFVAPVVGDKALGKKRKRKEKKKKKIDLVKSKHLFCFLSFIFIVLRLEPSSLHTRKALLLSHPPQLLIFIICHYFPEVRGQLCEVASTFPPSSNWHHRVLPHARLALNLIFSRVGHPRSFYFQCHRLEKFRGSVIS